MKWKLSKRLLAMLLCVALLIPNMTGLVMALENLSDSSQSTPEESKPEDDKWVPVVPEDIPEYTTASGSVSQLLVNDCGNGLTQDNAKSYFRMVTKTTLGEFNAYLTKLADNGFVKQSENRLAAQASGKENISTRWMSPEENYILTVYYTPDYNEVKIVADTAEDIVKIYPAGFHYEGGKAVTTTMMTMYGLSMSPNGYDNTTQNAQYNTFRRNCGTLIVIRMPDNSLFVNDGGDLEQWSDEACADFMDFCRKITNTPAGEKVIFNSWFISHAHSDHFGGLPRFIDKYHNQIDIKNVMYSLDNEMIGSTRDMGKVLKMIKAYFPDVTYYKPHTGEHFNINGIEFDVMFTQEDRFYPAADGKLSCGKVSSKLREDGTYRDFLVETVNATTGKKEYDFNDTSTVLRVTFPNAITGAGRDYTSNLYADANLVDRVIWETMSDDLLATDIMMVPHHGHDSHPELVAKSGAGIFLYTQNKQAIYGPDNDYTTQDLKGTYRDPLREIFIEMNGSAKYFETTSAHKTYWEGTESAVIFFGENKAFAEANALGFTKDGEAPNGFTVYLKDAPTFQYDGWSLLSSVVGTDNAVTPIVETDKTHNIRGVSVNVNGGTKNDILSPDSKYIIVHNATNQIMSFSPTYYVLDGKRPVPTTVSDNPGTPGSLQISDVTTTRNGLADAYFYYTSSIDASTRYIYFPISARDQVLWSFSLTDLFDGDKDGDKTDELVHISNNNQFGGDTTDFFYRSHWYKGVYSPEEPYWYTDPAAADDAWRLLSIPNKDDFIRKMPSGISYNIRVEFFDDGKEGSTDTDGDGLVEYADTCVIYYHSGSTYHFLTVDDHGNWYKKVYTSKSAAEADLEKLKLRLYRYEETSDSLKIATSGPQTYFTNVGVNKTELINSISYQLDVYNNGRKFAIPCSYDTPKVGHYWLDGDLSTDCVKQSSVKVMYRNDDGTDTLITTLTLHVNNEIVTDYVITANNGVADVNSPVTGNVYENRQDDGTVTDRVVDVVVNTKNGYVHKEVSVNVGMLSYDENSTVTVPGGSAVSAGVHGALASTEVETGTVYHDLSLRYQGMLLEDNFTLNVEEIAELDQPEYPEPGSVKVDKVGTAAGNSFFNTGIADIELSATGMADTDGVDLIITLDMSGSMSYAVSATDATIRLDALKSSMKSLMATLKASNVDFRIAISDFGDLDHYMFDDAVLDPTIREQMFIDANSGTDWNESNATAFGSAYEYYNHLNYVFSQYGEDIYLYTREDGTVMESTSLAFGDYLEEKFPNSADRDAERAKWTREKIVDFDNQAQPFEQTWVKWNKVHDQYTGDLEPNVYTGSGLANADAFVNVNSKTEAEWDSLINGFRQGAGYWYGTNYDRGLEYLYQLGHSIQQDNIDKGLDREVVAVFISDGSPMQYNYFAGRTTSPSWADWFSGRIDPAKLQLNDGNKPAAWLTLEQKMLEGIKIKNLVKSPDFGIMAAFNAEDAQKNAGFTVINEDSSWVYPVTTPGDLSTQATSAGKINDGGYFYLQLPANLVSFYDVMAKNGIRLDNHMLDQIARVNGYPECDSAKMTQEELAEVNAHLLELAKQNMVVYPNSYRYVYAPDATELYTALEAWFGYEISIEDVIQIAYRTATVTINNEEVNFRALLVEAMEEVTTLQEGNEWGTLSPYSYFYNEEGKNWLAEAIKGDTNKLYPVVNKYAKVDHKYGYTYYGTVRNNYSDGSGAAWNGQDYMAGYRGLGIPIYTLGVSIGGLGYLSNEDTMNVLKNISSGETYAFSAYSGDDLNQVFATITSSATNAANRAWFTDTMGEDYDLLTSNINGITPSIEVREYKLDKNHNRTGVYHVLEKVTFEADGVAKSTAVFDSVMGDDEIPIITYRDIWQDNGLIHGKYFYYNTTSAPIGLDLTGDGVNDYNLEPETFFWIIGTISTDEIVLSYQAYLTGSDDKDPAPKPDAGDYPTNKEAVLHYINYRGRDVEQDTISPEFPWGKARVGFAFYLVDENGNPVVNAVTGETGSIQNAVKLTRPVYQNLTWGTALTENRISSRDHADMLPEGFLLYTNNVNYYVAAYSNGTGKWNFQNDPTNTTFVQYGSSFTNTKISDALGLDNGEIHDTVVWFAVKQAAPLNTDKTVEQNGDHFTLTLEAFASGATSQVASVKPADIVLALDQSSSMYTPLGWTKDRVNLEAGDTNVSVNSALSSYKINDFVTQASTAGEVQENAKRLGYYLAVHNNSAENYMYLVHYAQNTSGQWAWYYISLDQTTRSIELAPSAYNTPSQDSTLGGADYKLCSWGNVPFSGFSYYKTQYGALIESVENFVEGLKMSGADHRLGIVGFASPFYDGWDHYDGSGLYIDGNFYLYDTDFMYQGTQSSGKITYTDQGFIEENWSGNVFLDPDKTFTDKVPTAMSSAQLQEAYANSIICKDANGNPTGQSMYAQALVDVSSDAGYSSILNSVSAINANYQQTCPSVGIEMAEKIFEARSAETSGREKILVLFTDGVPTVRLYSNREHGFSNDIYAKSLYWSVSGGVEDALDRAQIAKENGVEIYTVGTAAMQNSLIGGTNINSGDFLNLLSSNYSGVEYANPGYDMISTGNAAWQNKFDTNANGGEGLDKDPDPSNPVQSNRARYYSYYNGYGSEQWTYYYRVNGVGRSNSNYAMFATANGEGDDLNVAFSTIMESITIPTVSLNDSAELRDVLSQYFQLVGNDVSAITVYTAPFNADGTVGEMTLLSGASVRLDKTDKSSARFDIINVSGYDYHAEYYSSVPRDKNGAAYYGSKLIVKVDVEPREGFWGGNNVPTNDPATGVYDNDGTKVQEFPIPEANVPVKPVILAKDQVVYYGDTTITAMDLIDRISADNVAVDYDAATGTFIPAESWMDDYAEFSWTSSLSNASTVINTFKSGSYSFGITMKPRAVDADTPRDGLSNMTEGDGNIAGTPIITIPSDVDTGYVQILVPVITYQDSNIKMGDETTADSYMENNRVSGVQWVNMDDPYGENPSEFGTTPAEFSNQPTLTYTFTPVGKFTKDMPVDVDVYLGSAVSGSNKMTDVCYFAWADCVSNLHDSYETPKDDKDGDNRHWHKGDVVSAEFVIHVIGAGNGMVTNKFATPIAGTNNRFMLTLEAYATGSAKTVQFTKPADIVLVLDHSGSMRTPVGASRVLRSLQDTNATPGITEITRDKLVVAKAKHLGYYVAYNTADRYWYAMEHRDDLTIGNETNVSGWRGYKLNTTEDIIEPGKPNPNVNYQHITEVDWRGGYVPASLIFYKSQYAMLYDSVLAFVENLHKSGIEHNVAIVGFAGSETFGSRLYVGETQADGTINQSEVVKQYKTLNKAALDRQKYLYQQAMKNVQDTQEYAELLNNVNSIETNFSFTCPSAGLDLANNVLKHNPVNVLDRDRIVILFTDGIPNNVIGEELGTEDVDRIHNEIVSKAYIAKNQYHAEIHSISTSTLGTGDRTFLSYLSSDYPNAVDFDHPGEPIAEPKFTKVVSTTNAMDDVFESVNKEVSSTTVPLDDTTILMEILTDYVEFENPETDVKVYKQLYNGDGTWGQRIPLENTAQHTYYELCSTYGERTDTVKVFGFHYSSEYISDVAREVDGKPYYGSRLVAEVYIKARDGFWGGNNVPTNDAATGLYSDGERVESFPIPEVNMPISPDIHVKDQVIYFGDSRLDASDLLCGITVNGVEVNYDPDAGKFLPPAGMEWIDDYAELTWIKGDSYSDLDSVISNTESGDYTFGVNMKPIYDGTGNVMGTPVPVGGIDVSENAKVDVLVPMLTFKDSTIALGDQVNADYYNGTNRVGSIIWVNKDDPYGFNPEAFPTTPSEGFHIAPELTLDYSKINGAGEYFTEDFKVDVEVSIGDLNITNETYFKWDDCDNDQLHDQHETPTSDRNSGANIHKGSTDSHEFTVHLTCILKEDAVVIDFGIPVDISVLLNDILPDGVTLEAVMLGNELPGVFSTTLSDAFRSSADCDYGALELANSKLKYTSSNMQMNQSVKFIYAVKYTNGETVRYYYSSVTVIPATIIYYEDSFVKLDVVDGPGNIITGEKWDTVGSTVDKVQDEDRPKVDENDALGSLDMDSIYGYDSNYTNMTQYSLGSAAHIKVKANYAGKASFSFWGTGFDVISLSSCNTGTIVVKVTDKDGNYVVNYLVDTYYGYKFDGENWIVDTSASNNALYQVPVIKVDLNSVKNADDKVYGYGYYNVEIVASYAPLFDHGQCTCQQGTCNGCYDFYLDAIRIYDPANDGVSDNVIKDAYIADGEYLPTYEELRNQLISLESFNSLGNSIQAGAIFIDGNAGLSVDDANGGSKPLGSLTKPGVIEYANYGPNNEVYLAAKQAVAFKLNSVANLNQVHMALKSVGGAANVTIYGAESKTYILNNQTINTATDLYYNISKLIGQTVVIQNSGNSGMISITNIKSTYTAQGAANQMLMTIDSVSANAALASLEGEKDPIVTEGVIAPQSATLTYKDEILLNIYFQLNGLEADLSDLGLMTYTADGNTVLDTIPGATIVDGKYMVTTKPIAAKNLGDTVYFRVYAKLADGTIVYSKLLSYSPKTYAMNILNKSEDVAMKALVVAMLNYGAEAQKYFGYKTEALVNADLTAAQKALVADYSADMIAPLGKVDSAKVGAFAANGGFGKKYPTVSLEGAFAINYYLENSYTMDNGMKLYYWNAEDYGNAEVLTAENATGVLDGTAVSGIAAKDLDSTIYVAAVYESNGVSYCTGVLPYSVGAFCASMANSSALARAIAVYGNYAKAYFA